jgi:hypothetical protein
MTAEEFTQIHFPGLEKETWYPVIVSLMEGYNKVAAKYNENDMKQAFIAGKDRGSDVARAVIAKDHTLISMPSFEEFMKHNYIL